MRTNPLKRILSGMAPFMIRQLPAIPMPDAPASRAIEHSNWHRTGIGLLKLVAGTSPGLGLWPGLECNPIPGKGCPDGTGRPPASAPPAPAGARPLALPGGLGVAIDRQRFGVGMWPTAGCTGMPQGPPICVGPATRAQLLGPTPPVAL